jgi:hypothetical protein
MYTLEQLQQKTFGELKEIGWQLNVLPEGDRRRRQSWIDAIAGVNPPLLQLLEDSPEASVGSVSEAIEVQSQEAPLESKFGRIVHPQPAQKAIAQAAKNSPAVEVDRVPEAIEYPRNSRRDCLCCGGIQSLYQSRNFILESWVIRCLYCDYERLKDPRCAYLAAPEPVHGPDEYPWKKEAILQAIAYPPPPPGYTPTRDHCSPLLPIAPLTQTFSGVDSSQEPIEIQRQEPISPAAENTPGVNLDDKLPRCCNCFGDGYVEDEFGRILFCQCDRASKETQRAIEPPTKKLLGSRPESSIAHQLLELFTSSANIITEDSPGVKAEVTVSESAIAPAAEKLPRSDSDPNPILTGVTYSDRFLARYAPPQTETLLFQPDADGQLSLLNFEIESVDEPPDPDDFETLEEFREAIARWDLEHPLSFDGCSDLPSSSSVHSEPNSVHSEPLISLDSFCEWAACPAAWYEPIADGSSKVQGMSPTGKSSITLELEIGMLVGRRRDRHHLGKILAIYKSRRGIWRAKIQPLNKSNFVYFDCAALIEQRLLYDYEMKPGGFLPSGSIFDKTRGEYFEVYSRKVRSPKPTTNWTAAELNSLSIFKLKQIARDIEILSIPGTAGKRSLVRAILAEQAISQEKAAAQRERETGRAIVQKKSGPSISKKKRASASPLGTQLSIFNVAV